MEKRRVYQKPSMRVIALPNYSQLLTVSRTSVRVARSDYGENVVLDDWE